MNPQKILLKGSASFRIARCAALSFLILCLAAPAAHAGKTLRYKTYHPQTGENFNRFYYTIEENSAGGYQVHWVTEEGGVKTEEEYVLDARYETIQWRVFDAKGGTDYIGERKGNVISIRGQFEGNKVESVMPIDKRPFYYNPKLGLTAFVQSGKKAGKFWGFQNKELKAYPMKATNQGPDVISVNGKDVEAIKVYWTVDDFRSAFFKRTYWFRKSDGLYLKQKTGGGKFRELVSEEKEVKVTQ